MQVREAKSSMSDNEERLARLEADVVHLAQTMLLNEKGHATVADIGLLREMAELFEEADDE